MNFESVYQQSLYHLIKWAYPSRKTVKDWRAARSAFTASPLPGEEQAGPINSPKGREREKLPPLA